MGDALAVALMESRGFQQHDFARFHPGGSLGRKLLVKVKDVMRTDKLPFINEEASFMDLLLNMSAGRLGMVMVGDNTHIKGIVTDGDLRRALLQHPDTSTLTVAEIMTTNPIIIDGEEFVSRAEQLMIEKKVTTLLVGSAQNRTITGVYQIYNQ
jgi:arabinose-5-phosphate isomerase